MPNFFPPFAQQPGGVFPGGGGGGGGANGAGSSGASQADASHGYDSRSGGHLHGSKQQQQQQPADSSMSAYGGSYAGMNFGDASGMGGGYLQAGSSGPHSGHSQAHHSQSGGGSKPSQSQQPGSYGVPQEAPGQPKGKDLSRGPGRSGAFGAPPMRQQQQMPNQYMMQGQPFMGAGGGYNPAN